MSRSIAWQIPNEIIELAMKIQNGMDEEVKVWGAGLSQDEKNVVVIMDIGDNDWDNLRLNPEYENGQTDFFPLDDGALPVQ